MTGIYLETAKRRTFAGAVDWPGWARSGKTPDAAIEAVAAYEARYAPIAEAAGVAWESPTGYEVTVTVEGNATTDFGAPGAVTDHDLSPLDQPTLDRWIAIWRTAADYFERVAVSAPEDLRKGPRGGGRDTSKVVEHVHGARGGYAPKVGVKAKGLTPPELLDAVIEATRRTAASQEAGVPPERGWPARYMIRRSVWHLLDHAWEIEDRS